MPTLLRAAWLAMGVMVGSAAWAHGDTAHALPQEPGVRVGLEAAWAHLNTQGNAALPSTRLGGYLIQGDSGMDRRGGNLEHALVDVGWRLDSTWGAYAALGKHGSDQPHLESAWLQGNWAVSGSEWQVQAGRQSPHLGPVMTPAGHLDRFALMPLAKQAAFNGDWIEDGVQVGWRRSGELVDWNANAGLWQGKVFPGAQNGDVVPAIHLGVARGEWEVDVFVAHFEPKGRGAQTVSSNGGHSHSAPACNAQLLNVVCYDGSSQVMGASARWSGTSLPLEVGAAYWVREEAGSIYSANGLASYAGRNHGTWADVIWTISPVLEAGLRLEQLSASHDLRGPGATLVASEAGFGSYDSVQRSSLMLGYRPMSWLNVRLEAGQETQGSARADFVLLRAVVSLSRTLER